MGAYGGYGEMYILRTFLICCLGGFSGASTEKNKLCAWRQDMPRPSTPRGRAPHGLERRRADAT